MHLHKLCTNAEVATAIDMFLAQTAMTRDCGGGYLCEMTITRQNLLASRYNVSSSSFVVVDSRHNTVGCL